MPSLLQVSLQVLAQEAGADVGLHMPVQVRNSKGLPGVLTQTACRPPAQQLAGRQEAPDAQPKVTLEATSSELCNDSW